jgi:TonB family protein
MISLVIALSGWTALSSGKTLWPPVEMYPPAALASHEQGETTVRVDPASGDAESCKVSKGSRYADLDQAACSLVQGRVKAMFQSSRAITIKVKWYIPTSTGFSSFDGAIPFAPSDWVTPNDIPSGNFPKDGRGRTDIAFQVGTDGSVSSCRVTESSGLPRLDDKLCQLITKRAGFLPAIDTAGIARTATATTAVTWWTAQ